MLSGCEVLIIGVIAFAVLLMIVGVSMIVSIFDSGDQLDDYDTFDDTAIQTVLNLCVYDVNNNMGG